ncbi:hypothetical protein T08_15657 [Trichinella sp. T8]|nr:hypothetical protein T08_15657 [Trichinella sp. T8]
MYGTPFCAETGSICQNALPHPYRKLFQQQELENKLLLHANQSSE